MEFPVERHSVARAQQRRRLFATKSLVALAIMERWP